MEKVPTCMSTRLMFDPCKDYRAVQVLERILLEYLYSKMFAVLCMFVLYSLMRGIAIGHP